MKLAASILSALAGLALITAASWHAIDHGFALHDILAIALGVLLLAPDRLPLVGKYLPSLVSAWKGRA